MHGHAHVRGGRRVHGRRHRERRRHGHRRRRSTSSSSSTTRARASSPAAAGSTRPPGAYRADPTLTGKANFGFVSKYKKGANAPEGQTEFQFKAGEPELPQRRPTSGSSSPAHKAQYKGTGTINGAGGYGFLLTATDGRSTVAAASTSSGSRSGDGATVDRLRQQARGVRRHRQPRIRRRSTAAASSSTASRRPSNADERGAARRPSLVQRGRFRGDCGRPAREGEDDSAGAITATVAPTAIATTPHSE